MEPRIARLEANVDHIQRDIGELKVDVREFRADMRDVRERLARLEERSPTKSFVVATVVVALGVVAAMTAFQHQIQQFVGTIAAQTTATP